MKIFTLQSWDRMVSCGYFCSRGCIDEYKLQCSDVKDYEVIEVVPKTDAYREMIESAPCACEICGKLLCGEAER